MARFLIFPLTDCFFFRFVISHLSRYWVWFLLAALMPFFVLLLPYVNPDSSESWQDYTKGSLVVEQNYTLIYYPNSSKNVEAMSSFGWHHINVMGRASLGDSSDLYQTYLTKLKLPRLNVYILHIDWSNASSSIAAATNSTNQVRLEIISGTSECGRIPFALRNSFVALMNTVLDHIQALDKKRLLAHLSSGFNPTYKEHLIDQLRNKYRHLPHFTYAKLPLRYFVFSTEQIAVTYSQIIFELTLLHAINTFYRRLSLESELILSHHRHTRRWLIWIGASLLFAAPLGILSISSHLLFTDNDNISTTQPLNMHFIAGVLTCLTALCAHICTKYLLLVNVSIVLMYALGLVTSLFEFHNRRLVGTSLSGFALNSVGHPFLAWRELNNLRQYRTKTSVNSTTSSMLSITCRGLFGKSNQDTIDSRQACLNKLYKLLIGGQLFHFIGCYLLLGFVKWGWADEIWMETIDWCLRVMRRVKKWCRRRGEKKELLLRPPSQTTNLMSSESDQKTSKPVRGIVCKSVSMTYRTYPHSRMNNPVMRQVLSNVTLTVRQGQITCLLGPNGSGKTTLLKLMAGLMRPSSGSIILTSGRGRRGQPQNRSPDIGFVSGDRKPLFDGCTIQQQIYFYHHLYCDSFGVCEQNRDLEYTLLHRFNLYDNRNCPIVMASPSELQCTRLACALVNSPAYLLLVNPFGGLDSLARIKAASILRDVVACNPKVTIVMSTLDTSDAELVGAEQVIFLSDGKLVASGSPEELIKLHSPLGCYTLSVQLSSDGPRDRSQELVDSVRLVGHHLDPGSLLIALDDNSSLYFCLPDQSWINVDRQLDDLDQVIKREPWSSRIARFAVARRSLYSVYLALCTSRNGCPGQFYNKIWDVDGVFYSPTDQDREQPQQGRQLFLETTKLDTRYSSWTRWLSSTRLEENEVVTEESSLDDPIVANNNQYNSSNRRYTSVLLRRRRNSQRLDQLSSLVQILVYPIKKSVSVGWWQMPLFPTRLVKIVTSVFRIRLQLLQRYRLSHAILYFFVLNVMFFICLFSSVPSYPEASYNALTKVCLKSSRPIEIIFSKRSTSSMIPLVKYLRQLEGRPFWPVYSIRPTLSVSRTNCRPIRITSVNSSSEAHSFSWTSHHIERLIDCLHERILDAESHSSLNRQLLPAVTVLLQPDLSPTSSSYHLDDVRAQNITIYFNNPCLAIELRNVLVNFLNTSYSIVISSLKHRQHHLQGSSAMTLSTSNNDQLTNKSINATCRETLLSLPRSRVVAAMTFVASIHMLGLLSHRIKHYHSQLTTNFEYPSNIGPVNLSIGHFIFDLAAHALFVSSLVAIILVIGSIGLFAETYTNPQRLIPILIGYLCASILNIHVFLNATSSGYPATAKKYAIYFVSEIILFELGLSLVLRRRVNTDFHKTNCSWTYTALIYTLTLLSPIINFRVGFLSWLRSAEATTKSSLCSAHWLLSLEEDLSMAHTLFNNLVQCLVQLILLKLFSSPYWQLRQQHSWTAKRPKIAYSTSSSPPCTNIGAWCQSSSPADATKDRQSPSYILTVNDGIDDQLTVYPMLEVRQAISGDASSVGPINLHLRGPLLCEFTGQKDASSSWDTNKVMTMLGQTVKVKSGRVRIVENLGDNCDDIIDELSVDHRPTGCFSHVKRCFWCCYNRNQRHLGYRYCKTSYYSNTSSDLPRGLTVHQFLTHMITLRAAARTLVEVTPVDADDQSSIGRISPFNHESSSSTSINGDSNFFNPLLVYKHRSSTSQWLSESQIDRLVELLLDTLQMDVYADDLIDSLSSGLKKRLALARCLAVPVPVICIESAGSSLDLVGRRLFASLLRASVDLGQRIILATSGHTDLLHNIADFGVRISNHQIDSIKPFQDTGDSLTGEQHATYSIYSVDSSRHMNSFAIKLIIIDKNSEIKSKYIKSCVLSETRQKCESNSLGNNQYRIFRHPIIQSINPYNPCSSINDSLQSNFLRLLYLTFNNELLDRRSFQSYFPSIRRYARSQQVRFHVTACESGYLEVIVESGRQLLSTAQIASLLTRMLNATKSDVEFIIRNFSQEELYSEYLSNHY